MRARTERSRGDARLRPADRRMIAAGFALTLYVFYPGVMTFDARYVYEYIAKGILGDWQSPVMILLWGLIDPIAPGPGSMFLLIVTLYWLAFGLLAFMLARRSSGLALRAAAAGAVAAGLRLRRHHLARHLFAACGCWPRDRLCRRPARRATAPAAQAIALGLFAFGVLLRPNASVAAPILAATSCGRRGFPGSARRSFFVPAVVAFFALVQVVYYGVLGATRQHPLHSIMVFDLGGITHFAKENQFPVTWTEPETRCC